jgi:hypothetical protein
MPSLQLRAGSQTPKDNTWTDVRGGPWGELGTSDMSGFFAEQIARGNGYSFSSALAGVALIATTNTVNNKMLIWNPPTSGRVLVLQCVKFGRTAKGTPLEGSVVYGGRRASCPPPRSPARPPCPATSRATRRSRGQPAGDIVGDQSGMLFAPAASTLNVAPSLWATAGHRPDGGQRRHDRAGAAGAVRRGLDLGAAAGVARLAHVRRRGGGDLDHLHDFHPRPESAQARLRAARRSAPCAPHRARNWRRSTWCSARRSASTTSGGKCGASTPGSRFPPPAARTPAGGFVYREGKGGA